MGEAGDKSGGSSQRRRVCCWVCAGLGFEWHQEFALQVLGGRSVLNSAQSRARGWEAAERWGRFRPSLRRPGIPQKPLVPNSVGGSGSLLKSAWFATHVAFEVRSLPRVAGEKILASVPAFITGLFLDTLSSPS